MYTIYCVSCHGKKGDGNGYLSQAENLLESQVIKTETLQKEVSIM